MDIVKYVFYYVNNPCKMCNTSRMNIKLIVTDRDTGEVTDITDNLYWFEENSVMEFDGKGHCESYLIEIFVNDKLVYSNDAIPTNAI